MPNIDLQQVQAAVDSLNRLRDQAETTKGQAEVSVTEIQTLVAGALHGISVDGTGKVDGTAWAGLPAEDQQSAYQHLVRASEATAVLLNVDGPADRKSIMFRDYLSNGWVITLTLLAFLGTIVTLFFIHHDFAAATAGSQGAGPAEQDILLMVILMGVLGGFLHLTSSLAKYVGNRNLMRSWVIYYLLMPVEGSALAVAVYLLLRVGVLNAASNQGGGTASLNFIGIYGFSILAGMFSKQALEMLGNAFNTIFAKVQGKDAAAGGKPGNTGAAKPNAS